MPDRICPGPISGTRDCTEAVCIHTKKIYSSCKDKDCIEDLRVYLTRGSQCAVDNAVSVKNCSAELLCVQIDVEAVPFNNGFYTVDVSYFYRISADAYSNVGRPCRISGLASFNKRVILFGGEGSAKVFTSRTILKAFDDQGAAKTNLPLAVVEAVDPICLGMQLVEACNCRRRDCDNVDIPNEILCCFDEEIVIGNEQKKFYVTLGQFSIIRLERDSQLLMPAFDYCIPENECSGQGVSSASACELFENICFPLDQFFPAKDPASEPTAPSLCCCRK